MKDRVSEVRIRNVDAAAVAKIDQLAAKKGQSRNTYLKSYIEALAVLDILAEQENKFDNALSAFTFVLQEQGRKINEIKSLIEGGFFK